LASRVARLRIAAVVVLVLSAAVAALGAGVAELPDASVRVAVGGAAVAALVAILAQPIMAGLEARQRHAETELAATERLTRHLEQTRQLYEKHLQEEHHWGVPVGNGAAVVDRVVHRRAPAGSGDDRGDAKPNWGSLPEFVEQENALILLGEGGSGKTTSLLRLAAEAATRARSDAAAPIPIYLELKHFDVTGDGFRRLFEMATNAFYAEDVEGFDTLWRHATRPLLFLFDGLNEQQGSPATLISALQQFADRTPHTYVVTSRPSPEAERLLISGRGFVPLELLPLKQDQIRWFLDGIGLGWLWEQMDDALKDLSQNPFMLMALGQSCASLPSMELPRNVGQLYRMFIDEHIFSDREVQRGLVRYSYLEVKQPLLSWLAEWMTVEGRTVVDWDSILNGEVQAKLEKIAQGKERWSVMPPKWGPTDFLNETIANGILRSTGGKIEFMHQSVQEYFTARALENQPLDYVVARLSQLVWRHVDVGWEVTGIDRDDRYTVPVLMLCGLPDDKGAPVDRGLLVERLARHNPLLAAECVAAASKINAETLLALRQQWTGLLNRRHERYRWIGARCLRRSRLADSTAIRALVDIALESSVQEISSEAKAAVAELGLGDVGSYLADKVVRAGPHDAATQLLIDADPRLAVGTLLRHWQAAASTEQRQAIKKALEKIPSRIARAELERLQHEAEQESRSDGVEACRALLADPMPHEDQLPRMTLVEQMIENLREARARKFRELEDATPDELLATLVSGNSLAREVAASRLAEQGRPDMVPTLIEVLPRVERDDTAEIIAHTAYRLGGDELISQLLTRVHESDRKLLFRIESSWDRESDDESLPEPLRRHLERFGIYVEASFVQRAWGRRRRPHVQGRVIHIGQTKLLVEKVDTHLEIYLTGLRSRYLELAVKVAPPELILPELLRVLDDDDPDVRATALDALGRAAAKSAVGPIKSLLGREQDPFLGSKALVALARIASPEALETVLDTLAQARDLNEYRDVLQAVPESVDIDRLVGERAQRKDGRAQSLLIQELARLRKIRARSGRAIDGDLGLRGFLVQAALTSVDKESRRGAAEALRWGRGDPGTDKFIETLQAGEPARRAAAAAALGALQEARATEALTGVLADGAAEVRVAAAASLCELRADDQTAATNVLVATVLGDEPEPLRQRAGATLQMQPETKQAIVTSVIADFDVGRYDEVEHAVTRFLTVQLEDEILIFVRGLAREKQGDLSGALADMNRANTMFHFAPFEAGRARVLGALGRHTEAFTAQQRATSLDPSDVQLQVDLGWYAYLADELDASLKASLRARELDSARADAAFNAALVHLAREEESEARRAYAAAFAVAASLEPDHRRSQLDAARRNLEQLRSRRRKLAPLIEEIDSALALLSAPS
jgi:HEAT repeat protein